jgi:hypothetical protein
LPRCLPTFIPRFWPVLFLGSWFFIFHETFILTSRTLDLGVFGGESGVICPTDFAFVPLIYWMGQLLMSFQCLKEFLFSFWLDVVSLFFFALDLIESFYKN